MVAQSMINLHYRDPNFLKRGVPDVVRRSHQQHDAEQRRQETTRAELMQTGPVPMQVEPSLSQRGVEGFRAAVSGMPKKRPREETHTPDPRPTNRPRR